MNKLLKIALSFFALGIVLLAASFFVSADSMTFPATWQGNFTWQKGVETIENNHLFLAYATKTDGSYMLTVIGQTDNYSTPKDANSLLTYHLMEPKPPYEVYGQKTISSTESTIVTTQLDEPYLEGIYLRDLGNNCYSKLVYQASPESNITAASFEKMKQDFKKIVEEGTIVNYSSFNNMFGGYCSKSPTPTSTVTPKSTTRSATANTVNRTTNSPTQKQNTRESVANVDDIDSAQPSSKPSRTIIKSGKFSGAFTKIGLIFLGISLVISLFSIGYKIYLRKRPRHLVE